MKISINDLIDSIKIINLDLINYLNLDYNKYSFGIHEILYILFKKNINFNPSNPFWINRDRLIFNKDYSLLLYILMHLSGYNININDLKKINNNNLYIIKKLGIDFYNEFHCEEILNSIGLCISEKILSNNFNEKNYNIIDNYVYVFSKIKYLNDPLLNECLLLSGNLKLNKLIIFCDINDFNFKKNKKYLLNDIKKRFSSLNWNIFYINNSIEKKNIQKYILKSKKSNKPNLILFDYTIDKNLYDFSLEKSNYKNIKIFFNWKYEPFNIPNEIYNKWSMNKIGIYKETKWNNLLLEYKKDFYNKYINLINIIENNLSNDLFKNVKKYLKNFKNITDKNIKKENFNNILDIINNTFPVIIKSNINLHNDKIKNKNYLIKNFINFNSNLSTYIGNSISKYNKIIFINDINIKFFNNLKFFYNYQLENIKHIFLYTYNYKSKYQYNLYNLEIFLNNLILYSKIYLYKPYNNLETIVSFEKSIKRNYPSFIILYKKTLLNLSTNLKFKNNIIKGGYILYQNSSYPDIIIISNSFEMNISKNILNKLEIMNYNVRLVSIFSISDFFKQNNKYINKILLKKSFKIIIESSNSYYWNYYIKNNVIIIEIKLFYNLNKNINIKDIEYLILKKIIKNLNNKNLIKNNV